MSTRARLKGLLVAVFLNDLEIQLVDVYIPLFECANDSNIVVPLRKDSVLDMSEKLVSDFLR